MMHDNSKIDNNEILNNSETNHLEGFGGWLILFQLKVYLSMMIMFGEFLDDFTLFNHFHILRIVLFIIVMVLFYTHNKAFKPIYLVATIIGSIIMFILYPPFWIGVFLFTEICFVIYLFKSKRVKANFK